MESKVRRVKAVPVEVYSRIVGYFRPVQNWNDGKKEEWKDRKVIQAERVMGLVRHEEG